MTKIRPLAALVAVLVALLHAAPAAADTVCPPGWDDTSVGAMEFCSHPVHGSMTANNAWQQSDVHFKPVDFKMYTDSEETHWTTIVRNYNAWVTASGCVTADREPCLRLPTTRSRLCEELDLPSGAEIAGGDTCP